jgi:hypothetical protein
MSTKGPWEKADNLVSPWAGPHNAAPPSTAPSAAVKGPPDLTPVELSVVTPEQFDRAYEEYGQFGPRNTIPIEERWPDAIPDVAREKYAALKAHCEAIRWTTALWAEEMRRGRTPEDQYFSSLIRMIEAKYPFLTKRAQSQTNMFAWFVTR